MEVMEICVICRHEFGYADISEVTSDDLDILIELSKTCGDELWYYWDKNVPVVLHSDCKENYMRDSRVLADYIKMKRERGEEDEMNKPICEWKCFAKKKKKAIPELSEEQHEQIKKDVMEMLPDSMLAIKLRLEEQHSKKKPS